jgi:hypothetical protein
MVDKAFDSLLKDAIDDLAEHGFDSAERVAMWQERLRDAAETAMRSPDAIDQMVRDAMVAIYRKMVEQGVVLKYHPGVKRYTVDMLNAQMRNDLDKRILAAADLIKLNRKQAVEKTLQRFSGWSTSIPKGGSGVIDKREVRANIKKPVAQEKFETNRVLIDQGHKLRASISEVIAQDNNALAMRWSSHWRQPNYDYRVEHKERDGHVYAIRNNWALSKGLMNPGPDGYYDQITAVAEEPYCRCNAVWLYNLSSLPSEMLTVKGRAVLDAAQSQLERQSA